MYIRHTFSQALGSGAVNESIAITKDCRVASVYLHFSSSSTESVYLTIDNGAGANYDTLFKTIAVSSATDAAYGPEGDGFILTKGDNLKITSTNSGSATVYGTVLLQLLG